MSQETKSKLYGASAVALLVFAETIANGIFYLIGG